MTTPIHLPKKWRWKQSPLTNMNTQWNQINQIQINLSHIHFFQSGLNWVDKSLFTCLHLSISSALFSRCFCSGNAMIQNFSCKHKPQDLDIVLQVFTVFSIFHLTIGDLSKLSFWSHTYWQHCAVVIQYWRFYGYKTILSKVVQLSLNKSYWVYCIWCFPVSTWP